ncbi:hypothetical protein PCASD_13180 [Puccinia coronata f. sp. avenae]|uniref:Uncharacterized protein n=1 Tax=Puccinia coronata f. sp. avenae TaxID=200324 RepID=A0A2N5T2H9_9BASI|nr:hypothetical protein PCASD_13180 [Puccinia coronata f. sp. avenae]
MNAATLDMQEIGHTGSSEHDPKSSRRIKELQGAIQHQNHMGMTEQRAKQLTASHIAALDKYNTCKEHTQNIIKTTKDVAKQLLPVRPVTHFQKIRPTGDKKDAINTIHSLNTTPGLLLDTPACQIKLSSAAVHGYEYDPVQNRFFKLPPSRPRQVPKIGTSTDIIIAASQDAPPAFNFTLPSARPSIRPKFNPETDPGSAFKRSRHSTNTVYGTSCSTSALPCHLSFPSPMGHAINGEISTVTLSQFQGAGRPNQILMVGTTFSEALLCDFGQLVHGRSPVRWTSVNLSPGIESGTMKPLTCITSQSGITCFASTSGCVLTTTPHSGRAGIPRLVPCASFTDTTWSLSLTSQHLLMGVEKGLHVYDYQRQATATRSEHLQSSISAIERINNVNFLLGTRAGNVIPHDLRAPNVFRQAQMLNGRPIYHIKHIEEFQFLIVGATGYAKLHDIRFMASAPTISLHGLENACDRSVAVTISKDRNLVCMPGEDHTVKVWDLKSQPVPGVGLQPITTQSTNGIPSSVIFVDRLEPKFWSMDPRRTIKRKVPSGPGIIFGLKKALHWLGPHI